MDARKILAVLAVTLAVFSVTWSGQFVYDDTEFVLENPVLRAPRLDVGAVFTTAFPANHPEQKLYRPLVTLSYAWGTSPVTFHVVNTLWHLAVVALLMVLLGEAWWVAAFFAWHPLTTESVAWIAGRSELMAAFFVLAGLIGFKRHPAWGWLGYALALLCKENAIVMPVLVFLVMPRRRIADWVGFGVVAAGYLLWRQHLFAGVTLEHQAYVGLTDALTQRLVAAKVLLRYLLMVVWPVPQSVFHDVRVEQLWGALSAVVLVAGTVWAWRRPKVWLGWAWFFVALLPVSNLIFPIGSVMAERFTYLPLIGLCLALGNWRPTGRWPLAALTVVLVASAAKSAWRNRDWHDNQTLWASAAAVYPDSFLTHAQLGFARSEPADFRRALELLQFQPVSIRQRFEPRIFEALDATDQATTRELEVIHQLARQKQFAAAIDGYRDHLRRHPYDRRAQRALADCCLAAGDSEAAAVLLQTLVADQPGNALLRAKLGTALGQLGRWREARHELAEAVRLQPGEARYRQHLAAIDEQLKN